MSDALRNEAVSLGLEWGASRRVPLALRIRQKHPELYEIQIEHLVNLFHDVQSFSFAQHEKVYNREQTRAEAQTQILARFPFLDEDNLARLYNQGMYYAWHG